MKKIIITTIVIITSISSLSAQNVNLPAERLYSPQIRSTSSPTENKDEPAVRTLISTLETGWNTKSGKTFASVFADVHDYIVVNGLYFSNFTRKGNEAAHQRLFDGPSKDRIIKLKVDKITFFRKDLAQIIALGANNEKGSTLPEDPGVIMTVIAEKKNNVWKIISFHNHNFDADLKQTNPMPMNLMYASWYKK